MSDEKDKKLGATEAELLLEYEGMCIGSIEKKLGIKINTREELELRNRMKVKGSFYWQVMPWYTYEDVVRDRDEVTRIIERYKKH